MEATNEHLVFLDCLRESGATNMYGAAPYLIDEFGMSKREARDVLMEWMRTFSTRRSSDSRKEG